MAEHRLKLQTNNALTIPRIVEELKKQQNIQQCVTHVEHFAAREAQFADFPASIDAALRELLKRLGIERLYCHQ
ncbi:MAG: hypothetical protein DMG05_14735, partial [Acidobacteria bacterium]